MKLLFVLTPLLVAAYAASDDQLWTEFKNNFTKIYKNTLEEKIRYSAFKASLREIEEHNAKYESGDKSYFLRINQFADLTDDEFVKHYLNFRGFPSGSIDKMDFAVPPEEIDWRRKGAVLPVKDQGHCGSCWAFSTTGAIEGQHFLRYNKTVSLSEQELVDCSTRYGNAACFRGNMEQAFKYVHDHGISTEESYPYIAKKQDCKVSGNDSGVKVTGYKFLDTTTDALKSGVASIGPISIGINGNDIRLYGGGIFDNESCSIDLNHAVLAVGYGTKDNKKFWIIKNSWGTSWGERGYLLIRRTHYKQCGVGIYNIYPYIT